MIIIIIIIYDSLATEQVIPFQHLYRSDFIASFFEMATAVC